MNKPQRIMQTVMAILIVVAAIICHSFGVPDGLILLVAGFMLTNLCLEAFWVKNSVERARGLMITSTLGSLALLWYLFGVPVAMLVFGAVFFSVIMYVNALWLNSSTDKAKERITQWAVEHGGQLLSFEPRFETGPFGGWQWRGQLYFEFVVNDRQGTRHTGWAHFDYSLLCSGRYEIKWLENTAQPSP